MTQWSASSTLTRETTHFQGSHCHKVTLSIIRLPSIKVSRSNNFRLVEYLQRVLSRGFFNQESKKKTNITRLSHLPVPVSASTTLAKSKPSRQSPLEPEVFHSLLNQRSLKTLESRCKWPQVTPSNVQIQAAAIESSF